MTDIKKRDCKERETSIKKLFQLLSFYLEYKVNVEVKLM